MSYERQNFIDGQIVTSDDLNHMEDGIISAGNARNLLDNSDFSNPVNQRGAESYTGSVYSIDRWRSWKDDNTVTVSDNCITLSGDVQLVQYVDPDLLKTGKSYTCAVKMKNGAVYVASGVYPMSNAGETDIFYFYLTDAGEKEQYIAIAAAGEYEWAALYEGSYTADTLPEYIPKGYTAELLECQRYYYAPAGAANMAYVGYTASDTTARITIPTPVPMRTTPSVSVGTIENVQVFSSSASHTATNASVMQKEGNSVALLITTSGLTAWRSCTARFNTNIALSADL